MAAGRNLKHQARPLRAASLDVDHDLELLQERVLAGEEPRPDQTELFTIREYQDHAVFQRCGAQRAGNFEQRRGTLPVIGGTGARVAAVPILTGVVLAVAGSLLSVLAGPYYWLGHIWAGPPTGVGVDPAGVGSVQTGDVVALVMTGAAAALWARVPQ